MYLAYTDLLAYQDIDRDVDQLYRGFLDTTLMQYKQRSKDYRKDVAKFRRDNLDAFDRLNIANELSDKERDKERKAGRKRWEAAPDKFGHAQGFLYWFDVRTDYWETEGADSELLKILIPAHMLLVLYSEAQAVQKRIDEWKVVQEGIHKNHDKAHAGTASAQLFQTVLRHTAKRDLGAAKPVTDRNNFLVKAVLEATGTKGKRLAKVKGKRLTKVRGKRLTKVRGTVPTRPTTA